MILRFQSKNGQFRLNVDPQTEFTSLRSQILEHLPKNTDPSSIVLSNKPQGGDARRLETLKGVTLERVKLK